MPVVELHSAEHRQWVEAKNAKQRAQEALNAAAKHFNRCYQAWDAANRFEKKLRERVRKKLQRNER
jgi:hypothetical protein